MTPQETITLEREIIASSGREPSEWVAEYGRQYRDAVEAIQRQGREPNKRDVERILLA